ncbi:unnamed protein product [Phytophthora fragariaefolia]|uniref:Unnamed protein product n=1 Tax=Phytophthora fragariaefolia TaxID=1490495 RepID=A0A9W6Y187_9STRA|nr:unnamed protein product [Phytophthora fragariaefolia]
MGGLEFGGALGVVDEIELVAGQARRSSTWNATHIPGYGTPSASLFVDSYASKLILEAVKFATRTGMLEWLDITGIELKCLPFDFAAEQKS